MFEDLFKDLEDDLVAAYYYKRFIWVSVILNIILVAGLMYLKATCKC